MSKLNVEPRTIFCKDNIDVLTGINSQTIDLIYLDPPFNKKKIFTAPIGSAAEGAEFSDIFRQEDIKDEWVKSIEYENPELFNFLNHTKYDGISYNYCYLVYMSIRLLECHRILKNTGSIYLHCDPTMSHYLKVVMDCIFKEKNFRNEIVWKRQTAKKGSQYTKKTYGTSTDIILFYSKSDQWFFTIPKTELEQDVFDQKFNKTDADGRKFRLDRITLPKSMKRINLVYEYNNYIPEYGWMVNKEKLQQMDKEGRIYWGESGKPYRKYFADEYDGQEVNNIWTDIAIASGKESVGYPTQKPIKLLERIISASSKVGDVVLDPFCGCATTCVAAEKLDRNWIGIDVSYKAYELVKKRIENEIPQTLNLFKGEPIFKTKVPQRGFDEIKELGHVYIISNVAFKGVYKVGIAKNVKSRLNSYQTSDPHRNYVLEYSIETPYFKEIERHIHTKFKCSQQGDYEWVFVENWQDIKADIEEFINKNC